MLNAKDETPKNFLESIGAADCDNDQAKVKVLEFLKTCNITNVDDESLNNLIEMAMAFKEDNPTEDWQKGAEITEEKSDQEIQENDMLLAKRDADEETVVAPKPTDEELKLEEESNLAQSKKLDEQAEEEAKFDRDKKMIWKAICFSYHTHKRRGNREEAKEMAELMKKYAPNYADVDEHFPGMNRPPMK